MKYLHEVHEVHKVFRECFLVLYPVKKVSYESYQTIFISTLNISFGYPQTNTCRSYDKYKSKKLSMVKCPTQ